VSPIARTPSLTLCDPYSNHQLTGGGSAWVRMGREEGTAARGPESAAYREGQCSRPRWHHRRPLRIRCGARASAGQVTTGHRAIRVLYGGVLSRKSIFPAGISAQRSATATCSDLDAASRPGHRRGRPPPAGRNVAVVDRPTKPWFSLQTAVVERAEGDESVSVATV